MSERLSPQSEHESSSEKVELSSEQLNRPEVSDAEREQNQEKSERAEKQATEKLKEIATEKEKKLEKNERQKPDLDKEKVESDRTYSKSERKTAFHKELSAVREQLSPSQRTLSRVVHNPVVERVSEVAEETVFRPSVVLGGAVGAILVGLVLYLFAKIRGYNLPGSEFIVGLVIGAILGVIVELVMKVFRRKK